MVTSSRVAAGVLFTVAGRGLSSSIRTTGMNPCSWGKSPERSTELGVVCKGGEPETPLTVPRPLTLQETAQWELHLQEEEEEAEQD